MATASVSFKETGYFSKLICDYIDREPQLRQFYHRFPSVNSFKDRITEKGKAFSAEKRSALSSVLEAQYKGFKVSEATRTNIENLKLENCFTVTTGHQLNLFTGPLYFLYKIVTAINLAKTLKKRYPKYHFVPVYWMASEDHDFEEINFFNYKGKKFRWHSEQTGAVGTFNTKGLESVFKQWQKQAGSHLATNALKKLFANSYLKHNNLSHATRYLANQLFAAHGLVILDADTPNLKCYFKNIIREELTQQKAFGAVTKSSEALKKAGYKTQVNPRQINLFYLQPENRERIITSADGYQLHDTQKIFDKAKLLDIVKTNPENFSPNVLLRPVYQETILPNLCYIGGGGELAYWFQLKELFAETKTVFPILMLRNSVLLITKKDQNKLQRLNISYPTLFLEHHNFINKKIREISDIDIDFSPQKKHLQQQFASMYELAQKTDVTFLGAVRAQEKKQLKGLDALEKRLLKAQKKKLADQVQRMTEIKYNLFPNGSLQERSTNFSEWYQYCGSQLIQKLIDSIDPFDFNFRIISPY